MTPREALDHLTLKVLTFAHDAHKDVAFSGEEVAALLRNPQGVNA